LEHRAFAGDDTVVLRNLMREKWREKVGQVDLARKFEITVGELEILAHDAEVDVFGTKKGGELADHFFDPGVRPHVAGAVISSEQQLELLSWLPAFALAQHPRNFFALNS